MILKIEIQENQYGTNQVFSIIEESELLKDKKYANEMQNRVLYFKLGKRL